MASGSEQQDRLNLRLTTQEAFDILIETINKRTKFSVTFSKPPTEIMAYGGRGMSKFWKLSAGMATMGVGTVVMHYTQPKRIAHIFIRDINGITVVTIKSEGWKDEDSRISTFVNTIYRVLEPYKIDELEINPPRSESSSNTSEDPLTLLKKRFVKGEITKEEFEEMKKII